MFVPISDDNPLRSIRRPYVTWALIAANVLVFLFELTPLGETVAASFAIIPGELFKVHIFGGAARGPLDALPVPEWLTLISYMFFHGDPLHLGGNMLFLWVFGDNVEDALGHLRFFVFYMACGIAGGLLHAAASAYGIGALLHKTTYITTAWTAHPEAQVPLVGASGAVAGVIAAYLMLHPYVRVWVLAFNFLPLRLSAMLVLGLWIVSQFVMLLMPNVGPVAWWAHIGGILAGGLLVLVLRRSGVPLFDRPPPAPAA